MDCTYPCGLGRATAVRAAGAVGTGSPAITTVEVADIILRPTWQLPISRPQKGFEWTDQHGVSPTRPVTDPCVRVARGEAPGACEGWHKGLEEGDEPQGEAPGPSPTLRPLSHCGAGRSCHNLKKQHVPVIKVFWYLCTVSLVLNWNTCLSFLTLMNGLRTPLLSSRLPRVSYLDFEKNSVKSKFEFCLFSLSTGNIFLIMETQMVAEVSVLPFLQYKLTIIRN